MRKLTKREIDFINENIDKMSLEEISERLDRNIETIKKHVLGVTETKQSTKQTKGKNPLFVRKDGITIMTQAASQEGEKIVQKKRDTSDYIHRIRTED